MGFLGVIPADKLAAVYDTNKHVLTLSAEGEVIEFTYGFKFRQLPWVGGWKFILEAWSGPLTKEVRKYEFQQEFNLSIVPYPKDVVIVDANHPDGVLVPIEYVGLKPPGTVSKESTPLTVEKSGPGIIIPPKKINALFKEPFDISHSAHVPTKGTVKVEFDPSFLTLDTAGIDDNQIVWTFNSLQTGNTQVILRVSGGISTLVQEIIYDVYIFVLPIIQHFPPPKHGKPGDGDNAILDFAGRVNIGVKLTEQEYPGAVLYNVVASSTNLDGVETPYGLNQLSLLFRDQDQGKTVSITSNGYDTFNPPTSKEGIIVGNANIDWPTEFSIYEADALLKKEGHTGPYTSVTLLKPLFPEIDATNTYVFSLVGGLIVPIRLLQDSK